MYTAFSICIVPIKLIQSLHAFTETNKQKYTINFFYKFCKCWSNNSPGGTSGAHTTCYEEIPVLLLLPSLFQELCLHGLHCLLSAQASWLCQMSINISIFNRIFSNAWSQKSVPKCLCSMPVRKLKSSCGYFF